MGLEGKWGEGWGMGRRNGENWDVFQCRWSPWMISSRSIVLAWAVIVCKRLEPDFGFSAFDF
jgi:hypothetical protein